MPKPSTQQSEQSQHKSSIETPEKAPSQYHHFVPQFLLKNFVDASAASKNGSSASASRRGKHKKRRSGPVVNRLNLSSEKPEIVKIPVKRVLGQFDMYLDTNKPHSEQHHVEKMFSQVESKASKIFQDIVKSFDGQQRGIWLKRSERNLLRKFLFLMKYRGATFFNRYNHETATGYTASDREKMLAYMKKKGFERPIDVWLDNIKIVIKLDMDDEQKWISNLQQLMYPDDAKWFIMHCQSMFMAICTPSNAKDEFILTDNCYHVSEGPHQVRVNPQTGKSEYSAWINFHEFAPISPKLMIVLRNSILPSPEEESDLELKAHRERRWYWAVERVFGSETKSILADLPISKPGNNYTHIKDGTQWLDQGEDGSLQQHHKFFFPFFAIDTPLVNKIHTVFLDNVSSCTSVIFRSKESIHQALELYLTKPDWPGKRVTSHPRDLQRLGLMKLAVALKQLGSDKLPVWEEFDAQENKYKFMREEVMQSHHKMIHDLPDDDLTQPKQIYRILGGSEETLLNDLEQVTLMMELRAYIDTGSYGMEENLRVRNRELLLDAYTRLPSHRFWLYLKQRRISMLPHPHAFSLAKGIELENYSLGGPEDGIARARHIIKPGRLNSLMKKAVFTDIAIKKKTWG